MCSVTRVQEGEMKMRSALPAADGLGYGLLLQAVFSIEPIFSDVKKNLQNSYFHNSKRLPFFKEAFCCIMILYQISRCKWNEQLPGR